MEITFKDIYQPPFYVGDCGFYGYAKNGTKAFTAFDDTAQEHMAHIISILNGENVTKYKKGDILVEKSKLYVENTVVLVRGWGKLIGSGEGCYHLNPTDAAKIQDEFIRFVVDAITED